MPRIDPAEYRSLPLEVFPLVDGFPLHDVWLVELEDAPGCTLPELRALMTPESFRFLNPVVRSLFATRSILGRVFRLDSASDPGVDAELSEKLSASLVDRSLQPPGTPEGPFRTLYVLPHEAAYHVRNATVEAILSVAVVHVTSGHRFFWATYVKPVGRITPFYMGLIDPFRRVVVYPGLESWLKKLWRQRAGVA